MTLDTAQYWTDTEDPPGGDLEAPQWTQVTNINSWLLEATRRIYALEKLRADWDSYGSPAPLAEVLEVTRLLILQLERTRPTLPRVLPVSGGGVQLEWDGPTKCLEVEILPDRSIQFLLSQGDEDLQEGKLSAQQRDWLEQLVARALTP